VRVVAELVPLRPREDAEKGRVGIRDPRTEGVASDEDERASKQRIEKVEDTYSGHADEEEKRAFDAKVSEGLMQALEDPIAALTGSSGFRHKPSFRE
jgi:hypothetical protein